MGLSLFTPAVQVHYLTCCEQQQLFLCQGISHPAESLISRQWPWEADDGGIG